MKQQIVNIKCRLQNSSLFRDSFWTLLGSGIGKGLSLIAGIFVARFLGSEVYGEYGTIRTTLIYIAIVSTFGFGYTATKYVVEFRHGNLCLVKSLTNKILLFTLIFSIVLALIFTFYAGDIALFMKAPKLALLLRRYSILIVLNAVVSSQIAIISGFKDFKKSSIVNILSGISIFIGSIILTLWLGLDGAIVALIIYYLIQFILNSKIISNELAMVHAKHEEVKWREFVPLLRFSIPIALQESLYTIVHWITLWLLIKYSNYTQVGLSSAGALWQSVVIFIPAMLKNVMFSYLIEDKQAESLTRKLVLVNLFSSAIPAIIIFLLSGYISIFYGSSFKGIDIIVIISVTSSIFISMSEVFCYNLISKGYPWLVFISRLVRDIFILVTAALILSKITMNEALYLVAISLCANILYLIIMATCNSRIHERE